MRASEQPSGLHAPPARSAGMHAPAAPGHPRGHRSAVRGGQHPGRFPAGSAEAHPPAGCPRSFVGAMGEPAPQLSLGRDGLCEGRGRAPLTRIPDPHWL